MEMMVVLLIMAIIAAATAPIVSKKMTKSSSGTSASPWVFTGEGKNIAYNMGGLSNATAIIGAAKVPEGTNARLYIDCGSDAAQIALGSGDTAANILADPAGKRVGIFSADSNVNVPNNSVALGMSQSLNGTGIVAVGSSAQAGSDKATAIGYSANASHSSTVAVGDSSDAPGKQSISIGANSTSNGANSIALGANAYTSTTCGVAIGGSDGSQYRTEAGHFGTAVGYYARATGGSCMTAIGNNAIATSNYAVAAGWKANASSDSTVAIGNSPKATGSLAIAIGNNANASAFNSIAIGSGSNTDYPSATQRGAVAIGYNAKAYHSQSYAIGNGARTTTNNQIVLGTSNDTVYIPGNLIVDGNVQLATNAGSRIKMRASYHADSTATNARDNIFWVVGHSDGKQLTLYNKAFPSDKRLKNIGAIFKGGLNELKKLDLYNYTYKKDETKTPHVGVIAQDLQKVFPDTVTKGEDGYLRIRFEDMFFAMINAIKELDNKISSIITKNDEQDKTIKAQQELIETQQKTIEELEKRLAKLEKENS